MDNNTIAVIFFLVVAPALCALSIPLLSWIEGRNAKKQAEIDAEIDRLHQ
jgi:NADH:ubiquinone oxidoreductase subunit 3 (subunit A)